MEIIFVRTVSLVSIALLLFTLVAVWDGSRKESVYMFLRKRLVFTGYLLTNPPPITTNIAQEIRLREMGQGMIDIVLFFSYFAAGKSSVIFRKSL